MDRDSTPDRCPNTRYVGRRARLILVPRRVCYERKISVRSEGRGTGKPAPSVFNKHSAKAAVSLERRWGENLSSARHPYPVLDPPCATAFLHRIFLAEGKGRAGLKFSFDFRGKSDPSPATAGIRSLGAAKLIKSLTADEFAVARADISGALSILAAPPRDAARPLDELP